MFRDWENFYLLVGSAAGALIGLMFVVTTLTAGLDPGQVSRGGRVYVTPIVFHFAVVVVVSAISAVPALPDPVVGVTLALMGGAGFVYSAATTVRMFALQWTGAPPDWSDKFFYGFLPAVAYLALAGAAGAVWLLPWSAPYAVGIVMLVLLLIGIRNAWDLATALVQRPRGRGS
jgi:hypothetical protein